VIDGFDIYVTTKLRRYPHHKSSTIHFTMNMIEAYALFYFKKIRRNSGVGYHITISPISAKAGNEEARAKESLNWRYYGKGQFANWGL
jgi:hypothetical protein